MLLGKNKNITKGNTEALLDVWKLVYKEKYREKYIYCNASLPEY
jgi:hypothetical protein